MIKKLIIILIAMILVSCKKEKAELEFYYQPYIGKWAWEYSWYESQGSIGYDYSPVVDFYVFEFTADRKLKSYYGNGVFDIEITDLKKLELTDSTIVFWFEYENEVISRRLRNFGDTLLQKQGNPEISNNFGYYNFSYFKRLE